ncbi:hypothetical protein CesoFtcFv8_025727 [Champsocephalus esox]|uniref:Uncharacterized protein n=1 Tax=Champsocephalus esox TaxID=159716 RepID=A0AAN8B1D2_9TELE|nr:hypothetical protein CesoFtcFv8_025727 [Champsocephalus esox]
MTSVCTEDSSSLLYANTSSQHTPHCTHIPQCHRPGRCTHFTNRYNNTTVVGVQCAVHSPEDVQLKEAGRSSSSLAEGSSACASAAQQPPPLSLLLCLHHPCARAIRQMCHRGESCEKNPATVQSVSENITDLSGDLHRPIMHCIVTKPAY